MTKNKCDENLCVITYETHYEVFLKKDFIKVFWSFKLLPKSFIAITLFGAIFSNRNKNELLAYLTSNKGKITLNHEFIHILQANSFKTKYLGFYSYYLYYWVKNLFKYKFNNNKAYENIPFEKEAYLNENDFNYTQTNWKKFI